MLLASSAVLVFRLGAQRCPATYEIKETNGSLEITIHGWDGSPGPFDGAFRKCRRWGHCLCPFDDQLNIDSLHIASCDDAIVLRLVPRSDVTLDQEAIRRRLDFTIARAAYEPAPPN